MWVTLEELNQLNDLKKEIKDERDRLVTLRTKVYGSTGTLNGVPGGGNNESKISRYYPLISSIEAIIDEKILEALLQVERLERYIANIPDSYTRRIFTLRFVEGMEWQDVAQKIGGGNSWKSISNICYRYINRSKDEDNCGT